MEALLSESGAFFTFAPFKLSTHAPLHLLLCLIWDWGKGQGHGSREFLTYCCSDLQTEYVDSEDLYIWFFLNFFSIVDLKCINFFCTAKWPSHILYIHFFPYYLPSWSISRPGIIPMLCCRTSLLTWPRLPSCSPCPTLGHPWAPPLTHSSLTWLSSPFISLVPRNRSFSGTGLGTHASVLLIHRFSWSKRIIPGR